MRSECTAYPDDGEIWAQTVRTEWERWGWPDQTAGMVATAPKDQKANPGTLEHPASMAQRGGREIRATTWVQDHVDQKAGAGIGDREEIHLTMSQFC